MLTTLLLKTLVELEQSISRRAEPFAMRLMLMNAQQQLLDIQQEEIALLREIQRLRDAVNSGKCKLCSPAEPDVEHSWHAIAV